MNEKGEGKGGTNSRIFLTIEQLRRKKARVRSYRREFS